MSKKKVDKETMLLAMDALSSGLKSRGEIAEEIGIGKTTLSKWYSIYEKYGADYLENKERNESYTKEFKLMVVLEYAL